MKSDLITVLSTVRLDRSSNGFLLFWHRPVLKTKRTVFVRGLRLTRSDRTVWFGFKNLVYMKGFAIYFLSSLLTDFSMYLNQVIPTFFLHFSCLLLWPIGYGLRSCAIPRVLHDVQ